MGLHNTQDSQRGGTTCRYGRTLFASSETSKWEKGFRQRIRSYKDSLLHVHTSQTPPQEEEDCEISTQLLKLEPVTQLTLFCKLLP